MSSESLRLAIAALNALHHRASPNRPQRSGNDVPRAPSSQMHPELLDELAAAAKEVSACLDDLRQHQVRVDAASAVAWKPVMPVPSHMQYRGQVELLLVQPQEQEGSELAFQQPHGRDKQKDRFRRKSSSECGTTRLNTPPRANDDAARKCSKAAVCCVSDTHLTLFGGAQLDQTLLVLPLAHLIVEAHATHATVMSIRAPTAGTRFAAIDTRIFLQVPSAIARHTWLTVFQTRSVPVEGAFESQLQISSPRRRRGAYALSAYAPLVTWIRSTPPLESVTTHAKPRQLKRASLFRLQEEEVKEIHCNQNLPLNVANAFDLNFNSLKEYLLKQAF
jgi:hypothetical protein